MNVLAQVCRQPEFPHELQPVQKSVEARRAGGMRQCAQPGQTGLPRGRVVPEQFLQNVVAGFVQGIVEGMRRKPPGTGAAGQADAFQPGGARQHAAQGFQLAGQPLQDAVSVIGIERRPGGELGGCGRVVA